jgi:hypothetical protein
MSKINTSNTPGYTPNVNQLPLGDILINTYDGKVYIKKTTDKERTIIDLTRVTSSFSVSSSYAANGGVTQLIAGANITLSPADGKGVVTINASTGGGGSGVPNGPNYSLQYNNGGLFSGSGNFTLLGNNALYLTGSFNISGSTFFTGSVSSLNGFTGSLFGTSSWAISASRAISSSYSFNTTSASYAATASYSQNIIISGSINNVNYIDFNTGSAIPAWKSGRIFWDNTDGALSVYNAEQDITLQVGQENWTRVSNRTGATILNGTVVRLKGAHGDLPEVELAQSLLVSGSVNLQNQILGVATHNIENNSKGYITTQGLVRGLNTNAFNDGDTLFVGTGSAGVLQNTAPAAPYEIIPVGVCVKASPGGSGIIYVAVQEPIDFSDLSSALVDGTYNYGDLWVYTPTGSVGVWKHTNQLSGSYSITGSLRATSITGSFTGSLLGTASFAISSSRAISSSFALTASYVTNLNQAVTIGNIISIPSLENTLNVYPPFTGGTGEGGQILLAASGGLYSSASMLDTWQDQFRVLRGSNTGGSNAGLLYMNLQTGNTQFVGAVTASSYSGLPNDYLYVTRNINQVIGGGNWANQDIVFNNLVVSKGITYNTGTGIASLTGGKVYRITARLAWSAAAAYLLQYSCYTSGDIQIGPTVEIVQSTNLSNNISDGTLEFIYAPSTNTDIKIRTTGATSALSGEFIRGDLNTQFIIQQIA